MEVMVIRRAPELMLISELDIQSFLSACLGSRFSFLAKGAVRSEYVDKYRTGTLNYHVKLGWSVLWFLDLA
jgi:hypothetical protein